MRYIAFLLLFKINALNDLNQNALHHACGKNRQKNVEILLTTDIEINKKDNFGFTPFTKACSSNSVECVRLLLNSKKSHLSVKDNTGNTALHYVLEDDNMKLGIELIKAGADIKIENDEKKNCLDMIKNPDIKSIIISFLESKDN